METAMAIFDFLNRKPKETEVEKAKDKTPTPKKKSAKELSTEAGEPYISVVSIELDDNDVGNGAFELDWNEIFVSRLVKAGFMQKKDDTDAEIVDRWLQSICRNILNENFEQWEVNQPVDARPRKMGRNDLGNGRSEIS